MRNIILVTLFFFGAHAVYAQMRPFDNSKAILPWLYNPAADFSEDLQAFVGYDGRGNSSFTPQSIAAGLRMPLKGTGRKIGTKGMAGFQIINTSQNLLNTLTINLNFAQQISLNRAVKLGFGLGAGLYNMRYEENELIYMDPADPFLNKGEDLFNLHLNAGVSLVVNDRLFVHLAAPYLLRNGGTNIKEAIIRAGYALSLNQDIEVITAANLDTYNGNMIYGGDVRMAWRETVSVTAGADRHKYYGGLLMRFEAFAFGYTYGRNFKSALKHIEAHQIAIMGSF